MQIWIGDANADSDAHGDSIAISFPIQFNSIHFVAKSSGSGILYKQCC